MAEEGRDGASMADESGVSARSMAPAPDAPPSRIFSRGVCGLVTAFSVHLSHGQALGQWVTADHGTSILGTRTAHVS